MTLDVRIYLDDFDSIEEGYGAYLADLEDQSNDGDNMAMVCLSIAHSLQSNVAYLDHAFQENNIPEAFNKDWQPNAFVLVGNAGKKFFTRKVGAHNAVIIDFELVLRLVLFTHLIGLNKDEEVVAPALASFVLLSLVVPREEAFPRLFELIKATSQDSTSTLNNLATIISNFILFHELGHAYIKENGDNFLRAAFEIPANIQDQPEQVKSIKLHSNGPIYNLVDLPDTANGLLVVSPLMSHWKEEFASDIFAAYADLVTGGEELVTRSEDLERLACNLSCWQILLFVLGRREAYMTAIAGVTNTEEFSHPVSHARVDMLIHHMNFFAEEFAPHWQSSVLTVLRGQYESLWDEDLGKLLVDAVEYVRYAFDEDGSGINMEKISTFTGEPVWHSPSTLQKLETHFLSPLLEETEAVGWDAAISNGTETYAKWLNSFRLNGRPIIVELGQRLREVNIRFVSEERS